MDFYMDAADVLEATGAEFIMLIRHPGTRAIATFSNVERVDTANGMAAALDAEFSSRFGPPNPDSDPAG